MHVLSSRTTIELRRRDTLIPTASRSSFGSTLSLQNVFTRRTARTIFSEIPPKQCQASKTSLFSYGHRPSLSTSHLQKVTYLCVNLARPREDQEKSLRRSMSAALPEQAGLVLLVTSKAKIHYTLIRLTNLLISKSRLSLEETN